MTLIGFLLALIFLVLRMEYSEWAPKLAGLLIRAAARCHGQPRRMQEEWLADLQAIQRLNSDAYGLRFAGSLFFRYAVRAPILLVSPITAIPFTVGFLLVTELDHVGISLVIWSCLLALITTVQTMRIRRGRDWLLEAIAGAESEDRQSRLGLPAINALVWSGLLGFLFVLEGAITATLVLGYVILEVIFLKRSWRYKRWVLTRELRRRQFIFGID